MTTAPPGAEALTSDLCWLLQRASARQKAEYDAAAMAATGLTARKHQVLVAAMGADLTQVELGRAVGLDKTTITVTLDELERAGLAERRAVPGNRRVRQVAVTEAGRRAAREAEQVVAATQERILARLPGGEREVLLAALRRLALDEPVAGTTEESRS